MKIQVILRTEGQPEALVAEAEADTEAGLINSLANALDEIAKNLRDGDTT